MAQRRATVALIACLLTLAACSGTSKAADRADAKSPSASPAACVDQAGKGLMPEPYRSRFGGVSPPWLRAEHFVAVLFYAQPGETSIWTGGRVVNGRQPKIL